MIDNPLVEIIDPLLVGMGEQPTVQAARKRGRPKKGYNSAPRNPKEVKEPPAAPVLKTASMGQSVDYITYMNESGE